MELKDKIKRIRKNILRWYTHNKRDFPWRERDKSSYQILITEILLQKTRAENILRIYDKFFDEYPSFIELSNASETELAEILKPIGLYKIRSRTLIKLANRLKNRKIPRKEEELLKLPGIGLYVANSYLLVRHNLKKPIVDTNVSRLLSRLFSLKVNSDLRRDKHAWDFARQLMPHRRYKQFNWALLDFAALICKAKNPLHEQCILRDICDFYTQKATTGG